MHASGGSRAKSNSTSAIQHDVYLNRPSSRIHLPPAPLTDDFPRLVASLQSSVQAQSSPAKNPDTYTDRRLSFAQTPWNLHRRHSGKQDSAS